MKLDRLRGDRSAPPARARAGAGHERAGALLPALQPLERAGVHRLEERRRRAAQLAAGYAAQLDAAHPAGSACGRGGEEDLVRLREVLAELGGEVHLHAEDVLVAELEHVAPADAAAHEELVLLGGLVVVALQRS